eukprot:gene9286-9366_t
MERVLEGLVVRTSVIAHIGVALALSGGTAMASSAPSSDIVASTKRELALHADTAPQVLRIESVDPDARYPRGLGDAAARIPVATFDRSLCELTTNPNLHPDVLIPASVVDATAGASVADEACSSEQAGVGRQLYDPSVFAASIIPTTQWSPQDASILQTAPTTRADTGIGPDGELSSHPGLIQQPKLVKTHGDKISYSVAPGTAVGFDGKILRVRMASNIGIFEAAVGMSAARASWSLRHEVRPDLLAAAGGEPDERDAAIHEARHQLRRLAEHADAVVLTCSSLGAACEDGCGTPGGIFRADAALALSSTSNGGRVLALYAAPSSEGPTARLFQAAAEKASAQVEGVTTHMRR